MQIVFMMARVLSDVGGEGVPHRALSTTIDILLAHLLQLITQGLWSQNMVTYLSVNSSKVSS